MWADIDRWGDGGLVYVSDERKLLDKVAVALFRIFECADVVVDDQIAGGLVLDGHRNGKDVYVDKRAVLPRPAGDCMEALSPGELLEVRGVFRAQVLLIGDQVLEVATDRLSGRVPEELLGRQIPGGNLPVETERDNRGGADLQERLEVELLLSENSCALDRSAFGRGHLCPRRSEPKPVQRPLMRLRRATAPPSGQSPYRMYSEAR